MDFLRYEQKNKNYIEMFTHSGEDFEHYHCDMCEQPYPTRSLALECCKEKKAIIIEWMRERGITTKTLYNNINKLDRMFQKKEFGRINMVGVEFYPFSNRIEDGIKDFDGINSFTVDKTNPIWDIVQIGTLSIKKCYKLYEQEMHKLADEITIKARELKQKGGQE